MFAVLYVLGTPLLFYLVLHYYKVPAEPDPLVATHRHYSVANPTGRKACFFAASQPGLDRRHSILKLCLPRWPMPLTLRLKICLGAMKTMAMTMARCRCLRWRRQSSGTRRCRW